jgi:hypothetical protein
MGRARLFVNFFGVFALILLARGAAGRNLDPGPAGDVRAAAKDAPAAPRARFTILPFANVGGPRTLDFLQAGLPALVAERLGRHPGLRFAGPETIVERARLDDALARAAATGTRFVVAGRYEKKPNWKIAVTVEVYAGASPPNRLGAGEAEGAKDDVARSALLATLQAFERAGVPTPAEARARVLEPFARDGYAFVLYGRGVAVYTGLDQPWDPTTGRPAGPQ